MGKHIDRSATAVRSIGWSRKDNFQQQQARAERRSVLRVAGKLPIKDRNERGLIIDRDKHGFQVLRYCCMLCEQAALRKLRDASDEAQIKAMQAKQNKQKAAQRKAEVTAP